MLHILKNALGTGRVTVHPTDSTTVPVEASETIFGAPLSEGSAEVRTSVFQRSVSFRTVSVSPASPDFVRE